MTATLNSLSSNSYPLTRNLSMTMPKEVQSCVLASHIPVPTTKRMEFPDADRP
jgi:hypothetical protein